MFVFTCGHKCTYMRTHRFYPIKPASSSQGQSSGLLTCSIRRLLSPHPVPSTPGSSSRLPWPSLCMTSSALPCSPLGANLSTLPCDARIAVHLMLRAAVLLSFLRRLQRTVVGYSTLLQHNRSPESTGCLLRGGLTLTTIGLSPINR